MSFRKSRFITVVGITCFLLSNCVPYSNLDYQVVSIQSPILNNSNNELVYESSDMRIKYNLWGEYGKLRYTVQNKSKEVLYLDLKNSFFVKNGIAHDYYQDKTITKIQNATTKDFSPYFHGNKASDISFEKSTGQETAFSSKEKIAIPPNSAKVLYYFDLKNSIFNFCDLEKYPDWNDTTKLGFKANNAPFTFKNFLTYSDNKDLKPRKEINHRFWVHKVENIDGTNFSKEKNIQDPCDTTKKREIEVINKKADNRFYIDYQDDPNQ